MGSRRAAWRAGYHPKKMPTAAATPKDTVTADADVEVDQRSSCEIESEATNPSAMPTRPPARLSITASVRNCSSTSFDRAPTARRMPISRVR